MRLEMLTEELSMAYFLKGLLPRILPDGFKIGENCFIRSHEGKSHLMKSIPKKMKAYPHFPDTVKVMIIHDQDSNDCLQLKKDIEGLCSNELVHLIRIACRELENWYLGDFNAISKVFPEIKPSKYKEKAKYRIPDNLNGADEMQKLTKRFSKTATAREIAPYIDIENNQSASFRHFVSGMNKLLAI